MVVGQVEEQRGHLETLGYSTCVDLQDEARNQSLPLARMIIAHEVVQIVLSSSKNDTHFKI